MAMSLAELKAENAALETPEETAPQVEESKVEDVEVEEETEELEVDADLDQEAIEEDAEETEETKIEDWQKADDSSVEKKFTDGDIGTAKHKLRAKLERKHSTETDNLKAEIERLKKGGTPAVAAKPKISDFDNHEDPEGAHSEALMAWMIEQNTAKTRAASTASDQQERLNQYLAATESEVNQHYTRAAKLSQDSGISEELYKSSDETVRRLIDSVFPDNGDATTDSLIATLGEGSEKVFYHVGVNKARQQELKDLLLSDLSGLKAAVYLGELKGRLVAPKKRTTNAPKPAAQAKGDGVVLSAGEKKMQKAYNKAGTDIQKRLDIKREAKQAGINTKNW